MKRISCRTDGSLWMLSALIVVWYLWGVSSTIASEYALELMSPYFVAPAMLVVGLLVGGFVGRQWRYGRATYFFIVMSVATVIALPIYANASAAVGGLMIGLVGLGALELRETLASDHALPRSHRTFSAESFVLGQAVVLALVLFAAGFLVLDAQASIILTVPVCIIILFTLWKYSGPPKWLVISLGFLVAAVAMLAVVFLGSRSTWPDWLADGDSLSSARHTLWSDALSLWATEPSVGSGPGSFTPSSELASSVPSLAAVHSLPLQVGAELGVVGVVLLAGLFLAGMLFAARGSRPVAFIAIAAWTALAVHSSIDHLEDFPIVAFMGGVVLGWSGFMPNTSDVSRRTENTVG